MSHQRKVSVVGLGYVGLPVANAFGQITNVIGFDTSSVRIDELKKKYDKNGEISKEQLSTAKIHFTADPEDLKKADFHIVAVPTPVDINKNPVFSMLEAASLIVGSQLKKGDIVVYESTVYPGATEEKCLPILEQASNLKSGKDFTIGYSPERVNPGDKKHLFANTIKIVSGQDQATLDTVAKVYESVVAAGVYRVSSIKVAEAAKVIENTQRDINISLMNEIALILHKLDIDTLEVLAAAGTKWNFLPFRPGLVGGHCIGVDPYYLTYKAEEMGYFPDVILSGRRINDKVGKFIVETAIKKLIRLGTPIKRAKVGVLGITFKENCSDIRNSRVVDMVRELESYDVEVFVHDPIAHKKEVQEEYKIELRKWDELFDLDAIIIAVSHKYYAELSKEDIDKILNPCGLIMDVKGVLNPKEFKNTCYSLWRL